VHNWSESTLDERAGIIYIPFGTARFDFYGGNRQGANLFANSLVALDARTESGCGIFKPSITMFGTTTCPRHPSC
jgi:glucose dehydrogenase